MWSAFWTDLGRTCNILVLSFLDSALSPNHSGELIASSVAPERNQLSGHELQPQKPQPDPGWDVINGGILSVAIPALIRVESAFPGWRKAQLGSRNCARLQCRAGRCLLPFVLPGKERHRSASEDQNSIHFPQARTPLPLLALIIAQIQRNRRDLFRDLSVSAHVCERMGYLLIAVVGS